MIGPAQQLTSFHNNHRIGYRSGFSSLLILEETFETCFMANNIEPFNPFYEYFNRIMGELADGGLLMYWNELDVNPRGLKMKLEAIGPEVLTMEHLLIGFQICFAVLGFGILAFGAEIAMKYFDKVSSKLKDLDLKKLCTK